MLKTISGEFGRAHTCKELKETSSPFTGIWEGRRGIPVIYEVFLVAVKIKAYTNIGEKRFHLGLQYLLVNG